MMVRGDSPGSPIAAYVVWPGQYFVHRLLWLAKLRLTAEELRRGEVMWSGLRGETEVRAFMADDGRGDCPCTRIDGRRQNG